MNENVFQSSSLLLSIWRDINAACFNSELHEPVIGWIDLSDEEEGSEPYGMYVPRAGSIGISARFRSTVEAEEKALSEHADTVGPSKIDKAKSMPQSPAVELVYRLVMHETAHQASHQLGGISGGHGEPFLAQARRISQAMNLPEPTLKDLDQWPTVTPFVVQLMREGKLE